jgi:hypothetical protein
LKITNIATIPLFGRIKQGVLYQYNLHENAKNSFCTSYLHKPENLMAGDIYIYTTVKEGNMTTDLYSKTTDKHQYLSPNSCHPKYCFKSIPFSQDIRVKRIFSTVKTTKQRLGDLRHHLKRWGYNDKVIEWVFKDQ